MIHTQSKPTHHRGFTLVELMVVIVIVALLAALAFMGAQRGLTSAKIAGNLGNLRNLGNLYSSYAAEFGHYPPGYDNSYTQGPYDEYKQLMGGRGPDLVNAFQSRWEIYDEWLSPMNNAQLVPFKGDLQPTNYSGHPALCYDVRDQNVQSEPFNRTIVRRPGEVFLLCDGIPRSASGNYNAATSLGKWYSFVSESDRGAANRPLPVRNTKTGDSGPAFRNRNKCHVLFCDGHTESFTDKDFKVRHVALRF